MKKTVFKALLSLLCTLTLLMGVVPLAVFRTAAVGADFPWTKEDTLLEKIMQRDGLLDGIWYPWISAGSSGHNLTGNDVMAKYYDTNNGETWATVELDRYGADYVYREIYNLKAMGYNMMAWGGSIYGEGVIYDDHGDVLGIKQEYLDNARRLLNICRDVGMPVMWNIYFHSSACPDFHGIDAWNIICRMLGDRTVADHYAQRFVKPLCKMLAEYPDVVALVSIADEPENEINDPGVGDHFDGDRATYGVTQADMVYFMKQINDTVREKLPNVARTVASNNINKAIYRDFDLDLMGHNRYADALNQFPNVEDFVTDADPILTEYNLGWNKQTDDGYTQMHIGFRQEMMRKGYKGGFSWCWMPDRGDNDDGASYYLIRSRYDVTSFRKCVTDLKHYMDEYRAEYRGETLGFTAPVMYANYGSSGKVLFIPSKNAVSYTVQRSDDGGKTWKTLVKESTTLVDQYLVGRYTDSDSSRPKSGYCYRVIAHDKNGKTAISEPNNVAEILGPPVNAVKDYNPSFEDGLNHWIEWGTNAATSADGIGDYYAASIPFENAPDGERVLEIQYLDKDGDPATKNEWFGIHIDGITVKPITNYVVTYDYMIADEVDYMTSYVFIRGYNPNDDKGPGNGLGDIHDATVGSKWMNAGSCVEWSTDEIAFKTNDSDKLGIDIRMIVDNHYYIDNFELFEVR